MSNRRFAGITHPTGKPFPVGSQVVCLLLFQYCWHFQVTANTAALLVIKSRVSLSRDSTFERLLQHVDDRQPANSVIAQAGNVQNIVDRQRNRLLANVSNDHNAFPACG